ncbi:hypothetical protein DL237_18105 [Pseudooceanicola sediminis]|uniref:Uncharacterized protein n=1 Tax=Pseudooceanicola sediminis TaxID=2211117 RepID=A0A399IVP4_9RHOB|nr:hypothetical protein [Pseudooceanicola sediminis]KAA2312190.1 hypothetical protein E0K93_17935 [Puniceibacterium sp. HSS470]MCB1466942.1 hypothetical protein [Rhizobiaceae bacterium]RII37228.1 hypothetical protein DL237_18105 [Pseudooceanicola sediminis]|tara:strand:+ start:7158 stop:7790 length:633 start_codon:yes stop_codon:yes gene_type:complete
MQKYFAIEMSAVRFVRNTLFFSLLALVPPLMAFVAMTPGFGAMLASGGPPLGRFMRQVITNGLPVVFVVNYVSFFLFAWIVAKPGQRYGIKLVLLVDMPVRVIGFIALHVVIYVLSADLYGSFGGSRATALRVVAPTLARSFLFENISGVYLYATMVSALPLYVTAIENSDRLGGLARRFPRRLGFVLFAILLFGFSVLALTAFAALLVW